MYSTEEASAFVELSAKFQGDFPGDFSPFILVKIFMCRFFLCFTVTETAKQYCGLRI